MEFASTWEVAAWTEVDAAAGTWTTNHLVNDEASCVAIESYKADECALWSEGGMGGSEFWWAN